MKPDDRGPKTSVVVFDAIAAKPTAWGRQISDLRAYGGKLYAGYGDWNANGRVTLQQYDPATGQVVSVGPTVGNAIHHMIEWNGRLFVVGPESGGLYVFDGTTWKRSNAWMHEFGVVERAGIIYVSGQTSDGGTVLASSDDGATWERIFTTTDASRLHSISLLNDRLYVTGYGDAWEHDFAADTWTKHADIISGWGMLYKSEVFNDHIIGLRWYPMGDTSNGPLYAWDGAAARATSLGDRVDFAIDGGWLYALGDDGSIDRTDDLTAWHRVGRMKGPKNKTVARSVEVLDGILYVGGLDGELHILGD